MGIPGVGFGVLTAGSQAQVGALDAVVDNAGSRQYYEEMDGPVVWVELTCGGHMSVNSVNLLHFIMQCTWIPVASLEAP
jgi:hypothetical protein